MVGVVDVGPHQGVVGGEAVRDGREGEAVRRFAPHPHPSAHLGHGAIIPQQAGHLGWAPIPHRDPRAWCNPRRRHGPDDGCHERGGRTWTRTVSAMRRGRRLHLRRVGAQFDALRGATAASAARPTARCTPRWRPTSRRPVDALVVHAAARPADRLRACAGGKRWRWLTAAWRPSRWSRAQRHSALVAAAHGRGPSPDTRKGPHRSGIYSWLRSSRRVFSRIRDTCIWDTPIRSAI